MERDIVAAADRGDMRADLPTDVESITASWLSEAMGSTVNRFSVTALEGGVVSDVYRVHDLEYSCSDEDAPSSVVVKMAAESAERRQVALSCNAYSKELTFFRQLAGQTPIRSPRIYACVDDGTANAERFAIVMEDLSLHSKVFDQVDDPPDEY